MKHTIQIIGLLLGISLMPLCGDAQNLWLLKYQGTETTSNPQTNGKPKLVTQKITESTFVQRCANGADTSNLALVLHLNANELGDTLEVINTIDPNAFRCEVFKLAFQEKYTSGDGTLVKKFAYMYNDESGHSRGSAIITQRGTGASMKIDGKCQFWLGPENPTTPKVCAGTFTAVGPLDVP